MSFVELSLYCVTDSALNQGFPPWWLTCLWRPARNLALSLPELRFLLPRPLPLPWWVGKPVKLTWVPPPVSLPTPSIHSRPASESAENVGYCWSAVVNLRCLQVTFTLGTGCNHCLLLLSPNLNHGLQDCINQLFSVSTWDEIFSVTYLQLEFLNLREKSKSAERVIFELRTSCPNSSNMLIKRMYMRTSSSGSDVCSSVFVKLIVKTSSGRHHWGIQLPEGVGQWKPEKGTPVHWDSAHPRTNLSND